MDTYYGHVRTPADAIKLFEACRLGLLPRVQRRLSEKERQSIKSGSVFVWDEREAGMRRWTDGKSWSASRVSGSFLTYREMEGKRGGGQFAPVPRRPDGKTPGSEGGSDADADADGEGPDGYRYKPDGLMKQSFSITTSTGQHLHLISYYSRPGPSSPELKQPTTDPALRHIVPVKGMYPESTVPEAQGPAVTRAPMQQGPYMQSPQQHHMHMHGSPAQRHVPYPYQMAPGYGWPPSPAQTPPFQHYPGNMYQHPGLPQPGQQGPQYPIVPYHPQQTHHPQGQMAPGYGYQQSFGHPAPLPPPQNQQPLQRSMMPQQNGHNMSQTFTTNSSPHMTQSSPHMAQARMIAEQQAVAQKAMQNTQIMIDPRLTQPNTLAPVKSETVEESRVSTPAQTSRANTNTPSPKSTPKDISDNGAQASVPTISNLVHASDSVSVLSDNKSNSRSSTPGVGAGKDKESPTDESQKAKDIPHDKLNIQGEDKRAIRVLDRKFCI